MTLIFPLKELYDEAVSVLPMAILLVALVSLL